MAVFVGLIAIGDSLCLLFLYSGKRGWFLDDKLGRLIA